MEAAEVVSSRRGAMALILLAGAGLRLWQFLGNTSLWVDEIAVAENVLRRPLARLLFTPLDFDQVAPPGFLLAEKAAAALLGSRRIGVRREGIAVPDETASPVTAELYDLGIPERLAGASAETFPLPRSDAELAGRLGCGTGRVGSSRASVP